MVYVHAHTRSTPPKRLRCPPRAGARRVHQPAAPPHFCAFLRHAKFQPLAASLPTPPSWRWSSRSGFLQQHRAGASDTLASSPQKRENRVIVHVTYWCRGGGPISGAPEASRHNAGSPDPTRPEACFFRECISMASERSDSCDACARARFPPPARGPARVRHAEDGVRVCVQVAGSGTRGGACAGSALAVVQRGLARAVCVRGAPAARQ